MELNMINYWIDPRQIVSIIKSIDIFPSVISSIPGIYSVIPDTIVNSMLIFSDFSRVGLAIRSRA